MSEQFTHELAGRAALEQFAQTMLLQTFQQMGQLRDAHQSYNAATLAQLLGVAPKHGPFYDACLYILAQAGYLTTAGPDFQTTARVVSPQVQPRETLAQTYPLLRPHLDLLQACLDALPAVIQGQTRATDVVFPGGSMDLVAGIYRGTHLSDYFNRLVGLSIQRYVEHHLSTLAPGDKLHLVEVGGGTGGTTRSVLPAIAPYAAHLTYHFTDISAGFVHRARTALGKDYPFMTFAPLNIEQAPQDFPRQTADVVLGANVVHATRRLDNTLGNLKMLLKPNGLLLLNEVTRFEVFTTLTFGLLDGWWLFEDGADRLMHTPLLNSTQWETVLTRAGFGEVTVLGLPELNSDLHSIIIAQSDGVVSPKPAPIHTAQTVTPPPSEPTRVSQADVAGIERILITQVADLLRIPAERIKKDIAFTKYGVDSIVGIELVNAISQICHVTLRTTALFDYPDVKTLARHIAELQGESVPSAPTPPPVVATRLPLDQPQAVVLRQPGTLNTLAVQPIDPPPPQAQQVQIAVQAFALNFGDLLCVQGLYPNMPPYPFTPGFEVAGVVQQVGTDVTGVAPGDAVIAVMGGALGGHATVVNAPAAFTVHKPPALGFEEAAALPIVFLTAYAAFEQGQLTAHDKVLIQTAAGGVGLMAVQLAQVRGAEIFATAGSDEKCAYLKDLGVDHVINYQQHDFAAEVARLTNGTGVDVVLNMLSGEAIQKGLDSLAPGGRYIEIAMTGLKQAKAIDLSRLVDNQSFHALDLGRMMTRQPERIGLYLQAMQQALANGDINATLSQTFPFADVGQAYQHLANRQNIGKVVVSTADVAPPVQTVRPSVAPATRHGWQDIAIIGMSGQFPGADDLTQFWTLLADGRSAITEVPPERWSAAEHFSPDRSQPNKTYSKWGGFIAGIDLFDPLFFRMSVQEAELTDPQQRLFLQACWSTLEDAGYARQQLADTPCGVFMGGVSGDYNLRARTAGVELQAHAYMGNEASIGAARIAYMLNLKGPSLAIDTACSSSLVAIHLACQSLQQGECEVALAGGVFIRTMPDFYILSSKAGMLAPDDRCKAFDDAADGFVPGEGVGAVLLKPLAQAQADGDHIYGVIKGTGTNQDGKTNGITAPSTRSQTALEQAVYDKSGIDPTTLSYIECHGTGTKLGDPIEVAALTTAFRAYTNQKQFCALGSVKTNIGHAATAAGIAGMLKVLLSMRHQQLPPSLNFSTPNRHIDFDNSPFYVNTSLRDWRSSADTPRRAAISSFGFSGTNAHIILEEYLTPVRQPSTGPQLIVLSAYNETQLKAYAEKLRDFLGVGSDRTAAPRLANLTQWLADLVGVTPNDIDPTQPLAEYGLDQLQHNRLRTRIEMAFACELPLTVFAESASLQSIADYLQKQVSAPAAPAAVNLAEVAYTLQVGREAMDHRLAIIAETPADLHHKLTHYLAYGAGSDGIYYSQATGNGLTLLSEGEEAQAFLTALIRRGKLSKLAQLWISGLDLNWRLLYGSRPPSRIPLPTYPFARRRCWITEPPPPPPAPTPPAPTLHYYAPGWTAAPLPPDSAVSLGRVLVFGTAETPRHTLAQVCTEPPLLITQGTQFGLDQHRVTLNPRNPADYGALLQQISGDVNIIYTWNLAPNLVAPPDTTHLEMLTHLHHAIDTANVAGRVRLIVLGSAALPDGIPAQTAVAGYLASWHIENPAVRGCLVQLDDTDALSTSLTLAVRELHHLGRASAIEVRYDGGQRLQRHYEAVTPTETTATPLFKTGGIYLITGGAGGIGRIIAQHLTQTYQAHVILTGRSAPDATTAHLCQTLGSTRYMQADITNQAAVQAVIATIKREMGPLTGVIHAAGVLEGGLDAGANFATTTRVLAPKVAGTVILDEATRAEPLDLFMAVSSLSAIVGTGGYGAYAAGNRFMDAYIHLRNTLASQGQRTGRAITINWPLWQDGGMASGSEGLSATAGITALEAAGRTGLAQVAVLTQPDQIARLPQPAADPVAAYYDAYGNEISLEETHNLYLNYAPFPAILPDFSWVRLFFERSPNPGPQELRFRQVVIDKHRELRNVLFRQVPFDRLSRALDIGCGYGSDLLWFARTYPHLHVDGYTISPKQAELGTKRIQRAGLSDRLRVFCRDSSRDPFPDRYDLVYAIEVMVHIADKESLFDNIARHLKPGGYLMIADFVSNLRTDIDDEAIGAHTITSEHWAQLFSANGLKLAQAVDVGQEISNFLYDPDFHANQHVSEELYANPLVRRYHAMYNNLHLSLKDKLVNYALFALRKDPQPDLLTHNRTMLTAMTVYRHLLNENPSLAVDSGGVFTTPTTPVPPVATPTPQPEAQPLVSTQDVVTIIQEEVGRVLKYDPAELHPSMAFEDLGTDSINAVKIIEALNVRLNLYLKTTLLFSYPTIEALGRHIEAVGQPLAAPPDQPTNGNSAHVNDLLAQIDSMSQADVEALAHLLGGVDHHA